MFVQYTYAGKIFLRKVRLVWQKEYFNLLSNSKNPKEFIVRNQTLNNVWAVTISVDVWTLKLLLIFTWYPMENVGDHTFVHFIHVNSFGCFILYIYLLQVVQGKIHSRSISPFITISYEAFICTVSTNSQTLCNVIQRTCCPLFWYFSLSLSFSTPFHSVSIPWKCLLPNTTLSLHPLDRCTRFIMES